MNISLLILSFIYILICIYTYIYIYTYTYLKYQVDVFFAGLLLLLVKTKNLRKGHCWCQFFAFWSGVVFLCFRVVFLGLLLHFHLASCFRLRPKKDIEQSSRCMKCLGLWEDYASSDKSALRHIPFKWIQASKIMSLAVWSIQGSYGFASESHPAAAARVPHCTSQSVALSSSQQSNGLTGGQTHLFRWIQTGQHQS